MAELVQSTLPVLPAHKADIDYELFLDCVHCGLCTSACPTYVELGDENDSPRGRIYLMRALTDGRIELNPQVRRHLDLCLDCRACESACPSGVQYGKLIEPFRIHLSQTAGSSEKLGFLKKLLLYRFTPYRNRMRRALAPARLMQRIGLDWLLTKIGFFRLLPKSLRELHAMLPPLRRHYGSLPEVLPAIGPKRARVALFIGCAADAFFPQTTLATARVLQRNGCEVWIPPGQGCCGALHYHAAREEPALAFAAANLRTFLPPALGAGLPTPPPARRGSPDPAAYSPSVDAIVVNAAGCGAMLKEYGHIMHRHDQADVAAKFAGKVKDVSEFLVELGPVKPEHPLKMRAVYHDACHLCHGQQIRKPPRQLLEMIPGLELVSLNETEICCGAAGSYNLTQPDMAERLGRRKAQNILDTGAGTVFAGNVGCLLQIARYLREQRPDLKIAHPVDALWASYAGLGLQ